MRAFLKLLTLAAPLWAAACLHPAMAQPVLPRIVGTGPFLLVQPDGQVSIIGELDYLPHGDGTPLRRGVRTQPKPVPGIGDAVDAAGTSEHAVVALSDGRVVGWGERCAATGRSERNVSSPFLQPMPVAGVAGVVQVVAGKGFSAARTVDGSVLLWGERGAGRGGLVDATMDEECAAPKRLPLAGIVHIAAAQQQLLALARDGSVWAAGANPDGALGTGRSEEGVPPTKLPGLSDVVQLAALGDRTVALRRDGSVWQWGHELSERPVRVPFTGRAIAVQGYGRFAMLQAADGSLWGWGEGYGGTFGNGSFDRVSDKPLQVPLNFRPVAWFALNHAGFAWQPDGTLVGWGAHGFTPPGTPRRGHSVRPEPLIRWTPPAQWDSALRPWPAQVAR